MEMRTSSIAVPIQDTDLDAIGSGVSSAASSPERRVTRWTHASDTEIQSGIESLSDALNMAANSMSERNEPLATSNPPLVRATATTYATLQDMQTSTDTEQVLMVRSNITYAELEHRSAEKSYVTFTTTWVSTCKLTRSGRRLGT